MPDIAQQFLVLEQEFQVLDHNLIECQDLEQRIELLKAMALVIEKFDRLSLEEQRSLDSNSASTAPTNPPLTQTALH
jgi:hypothetical protein